MDMFLDLTDRFPFQFDVERMKAEIRAVEDQCLWLDHYDKALADGWRAIPLVSQHGRMDGPESQRWGDVREFRRTPVVDRMPYFRSILDAFDCPQGRVRILRLEPGTGIGLHRDIAGEVASYAFNQVRLHVPIQTNDRVTFFVGGRTIRMRPGRLYHVDFTRPHYVRNDGPEPRIHLVLDLKMNPFLRGLFPPVSAAERVGHWCLRQTLPVVWQMQFARIGLMKWFWRRYNGSAAQGLLHRLRGTAVSPG